MECSLPGSSVNGILQARVLKWGAIAFSKKELDTTQQIKNNSMEKAPKKKKKNLHAAQLKLKKN